MGCFTEGEIYDNIKNEKNLIKGDFYGNRQVT